MTFVLIVRGFLLAMAFLFLVGVIVDSDPKNKNLFFTVAFILLVLLLVAMKIL